MRIDENDVGAIGVPVGKITPLCHGGRIGGGIADEKLFGGLFYIIQGNIVVSRVDYPER